MLTAATDRVRLPWRLAAARGEAGIALPMALIVLVVLTSLAAAVLAVGTSETTISMNHMLTAQALSLAEAGLESAFTAINSSLTGASLIAAAATACGTASPCPFAAMSVTLPASGSALAATGTYSVQYRSTGTNTVEVVSTGTTTQGSARRVLRAIMTSSLNAVTAVLSKDNITISGSTTVNGVCGSVHSNVDLSLTGTGNLIAQNATASRDYSASGTPTIGGVAGGDRPQKVVPDINPATYLAQALTKVTSDANLAVYQLNSDGTITRTTSAGTINPGIVAGWTYTAAAGVNPAKWEVTASNPPGTSGDKAVFYVSGDAAINGLVIGSSGSRWNATILVGTYTVGAQTRGGQFDLRANADVYLDPALNDLAVASSGDFNTAGNSTINISTGVIAAGGTVDIGGNATITGSIIAEGETKLHGNVAVTYNCGLDPGITTALSIVAWGY